MYVLFEIEIKINNIIFELVFLLKISTTTKSQKKKSSFKKKKKIKNKKKKKCDFS